LITNSIRDASMALGIRRWRTTLSVLLTTAKSGVVTGILLAIARVAGETSPPSLYYLGEPVFLLRPQQPDGRASNPNIPAGAAALSLCAGTRVGSSTGANTHGLGC